MSSHTLDNYIEKCIKNEHNQGHKKSVRLKIDNTSLSLWICDLSKQDNVTSNQ